MLYLVHSIHQRHTHAYCLEGTTAPSIDVAAQGFDEGSNESVGALD